MTQTPNDEPRGLYELCTEFVAANSKDHRARHLQHAEIEARKVAWEAMNKARAAMLDCLEVPGANIPDDVAVAMAQVILQAMDDEREQPWFPMDQAPRDELVLTWNAENEVLELGTLYEGWEDWVDQDGVRMGTPTHWRHTPEPPTTPTGGTKHG